MNDNRGHEHSPTNHEGSGGSTGDADRFSGDATGERGYRGDSAPDTPPGSVPGGSYSAGGRYRQGGFDNDAPQNPEDVFDAGGASTEDFERGDWDGSRGDLDASRRDQSGHDRQEWRDGFGAYGFPGYEESGANGPRTGYGEQGFGAGESHGGRWGGGTRGGYGGGNPGGVHGSRGGSWAAGADRVEQGRGPRSYGPDGWGGRPGPAGPGQRGSTWGGASRGGRHPGAGSAGPDQHADSYGAWEAPWRQSEFAGRGEFGDHERGTWSDERGYSARAHGESGTARGDRWSVPGPFSGRGPRDYRRSEAAIRDDVCERLTRHGHLDASGVRVQVENGEVVLEGTVDSRLAKRMAEDVAETVSGVRDVHNRLRIRASEHDRERTDGGSDR